jgi:hypothetical protein
MALKNLISVGPMSLEYAVVEKGLPKALSNRALQVGGRCAWLCAARGRQLACAHVAAAGVWAC